MDIRNTDRLDSSPDRVSELFCTEAFQLAAHSAREDVASARFEVIDDDERRRTIAVRCQQYRRKKTGGLDRKHTDDTAIIYRWDRQERRAVWHFEGPDADKIRIGGVTTFEAEGDGTLVVESVHIEVRLPLIGKLIERVVAKGIDRTFHANKNLIRDLLAG